MWRWFLLCCWLPLQAAEPAHLVTKHWPGYTNQDLTGGYFELIQLLLPADQVTLKIELTGFGRAVLMVQKQQADMVLAVTAHDGQQMLLSAHPIDADIVMAVYHRDFKVPNDAADLSLSHLTQLRLGWEKGYNYGQALALDTAGYEVEDAVQGLEMLNKGRLDVYLAEAFDLTAPAAQLLSRQLALKQQHLTEIPIYIGFSRSARGQVLKSIWDQQFALFARTGELQKFYQRYPNMHISNTLPAAE